MKITLLTPTFSAFSGIDRVVQMHAEELSRKNEVTVICLKADIPPKGYRLVVLGAPASAILERLYRLFFFMDFPKIIRTARLLKGQDRIVSYFYPMNWICWLAKKLYGKNWTYYDMGFAFPELFTNLVERTAMRLFKLFNRLSCNASDAISISRFLSRELQKDTGLRSKVMHIRIDSVRFNLKVKGGEAIRKKYGIGSGPLLLYIGRLSPHKGIHLLVEAFRKVEERIPAAKLLIVGKPTFKAYFEKLKSTAGRNVVFAGYVPDKDMPACYAACSLYTTATLWEGYDMPAVEAQACGRKVVAFDLCSHPEIVKNGILVAPRDTGAFAEAVIRLLAS